MRGRDVLYGILFGGMDVLYDIYIYIWRRGRNYMIYDDEGRDVLYGMQHGAWMH